MSQSSKKASAIKSKMQKQKSQTSKTGKGKSKNAVGTSMTVSNALAPVAIATNLTRGLGLNDIKGLRIGYLAGYTYVGNGTLGATLGVYFLDATQNHVFTTPAPILPSDAAIGQSYVADVFKHFMRRTYRSVRVHLLSLNPNTANVAVVNFAPVRGGGILPAVTASTSSPLSQAGVMGMNGHGQIASWQSAYADLSSFIAGGSGASQNEFNQATSAAAESSPSQASVSLASPCGFAIAGSATTAALEGLVLHAVIVEVVVDLLDFVASILPGGTVAGKSERFTPSDFPLSAASHGSVSLSDEKKVHDSVRASSRSDPIKEDYVELLRSAFSSPIGGAPLRVPSRIESRMN